MPRESVVAAVHRCTEGNPLFVGEAARLLAAEGRLERAWRPGGAGRWSSRKGSARSIGRRVARLPEPMRLGTGPGVGVGCEFWLPALERLCGISAGELLDVLDDGIAACGVAAVPGAPGRAVVQPRRPRCPV